MYKYNTNNPTAKMLNNFINHYACNECQKIAADQQEPKKPKTTNNTIQQLKDAGMLNLNGEYT
jgi:hypothetical protein